MDHEEYEAKVRAALAAARESLGNIEMIVREEGERPDLMEASRAYAQFCMYVREYISSVHARKPLPRRFAQRIGSLHDALASRREALAERGLRPAPEEIADLMKAAEELPGTA